VAKNPTRQRGPTTKSGKRRGAEDLVAWNLLAEESHDYSLSDVQRLFNIPPSLVRKMVRAGYITAAVSEGPMTFSFNDLLILRTAGALKAAKIGNAQLISAVAHIRAALTPRALLTTLALGAADHPFLVRVGDKRWDDHVMRAADRLTPGMSVAGTAVQRTAPMLEADAHFARGHALEDSDIDAARAAYLDALNSHGQHLEARINLGRLLHLNGEFTQAEKVYRQAKQSSALLSFNLAILLEDLDREGEAIEAYREALALDPHLHDAHFNLSRLHERAKQPREALRHLLAYRRHHPR
jgi:tetratricopeptide (TPR) repeat protein